MSVWTLIIVVTVFSVIWFVVKRFYFDPAEQEQLAAVKQAMTKQAQKRDGRVDSNGRQPVLHVTTKYGEIHLSLLTVTEEIFREHAYARFRVEQFADKKFAVLRRSDNLLLKPVPIGTRVDLGDKEFNEQFVVTGNDSEFVAKVLTTQIRDQLRMSSLQVSLGRRTDRALIDRERGWLSVHTQFLKTGDEIFDALIETAMLFQARFAALAGESQIRSQ